MNRIRITALSIIALASLAHPLAAQTFDPERHPLSTLLAVPADGVSYFRNKLLARMLIQAENGVEAERISASLTRDYPRDGENWLLLARSKELLRKHAEAAAMYEKADSILGWTPVSLSYEPNARVGLMVQAAVNHLAAGDTVAALHVLQKGVREHHYPFPGELYGDTRLAPLREHPAFIELVGRPDVSRMTRESGWRRDVELLYKHALQARPLSRLDPVPAEFGRRYEALRQDIPRLSDEEIVVAMNRMLAVLHQGHTWLADFTGSRIASKGLPVLMWLFPEGVFIIDAADDYADLIGARVVKIGNASIGEALKKTSLMHSVDGDMQYTTDVMRSLRHTGFIKGLGFAASLDSVEFVVQPPQQPERAVMLTPRPWAYFGKMSAPRGVQTPLFLRDVRQMHWDAAMPEADAHYIQINNMFDDEGETLPQFGVRMRRVLARRSPKNLIIDVRHNNGGNSALHTELERTIIGFSQLPGRQVYVLMGRKTYSAASNFITDLERFASPVFVGEAPAECCNFYADPTPVYLPYSRMTGALSALISARSADALDRRREISPHVPVQLTASDYFTGKDPVMDAVLRLVAERTSSNSTDNH